MSLLNKLRFLSSTIISSLNVQLSSNTSFSLISKHYFIIRLFIEKTILLSLKLIEFNCNLAFIRLSILTYLLLKNYFLLKNINIIVNLYEFIENVIGTNIE